MKKKKKNIIYIGDIENPLKFFFDGNRTKNWRFNINIEISLVDNLAFTILKWPTHLQFLLSLIISIMKYCIVSDINLTQEPTYLKTVQIFSPFINGFIANFKFNLKDSASKKARSFWDIPCGNSKCLSNGFSTKSDNKRRMALCDSSKAVTVWSRK